MSRKVIIIAIVALALAGGGAAWLILSKPALPPGFAGVNGRLEAKQVDIATKYPGRIKEVLADEGDTVDEGQVVATMDTEPLEAQLRQAAGQISEAQDNRAYRAGRSRGQESRVDLRRQAVQSAPRSWSHAARSASRNGISTLRACGRNRAALLGAQAQAVRTQSAIDAATAEAERIQAEIKDSVLKAPIRGRVQNRLAEPGEVLPAGGKVLALVDLSDVYMYVFLPEAVAGKVALGAEARIVLDAYSRISRSGRSCRTFRPAHNSRLRPSRPPKSATI